MVNKFSSTGTKRALTTSTQWQGETLLNYYGNEDDQNTPWPGEPIPPYMGEPMPNEFFQRLVDMSTNEYFNKTRYSNPQRLTPANPAPTEFRYRDCSSFIWDIYTKAGFKNLGGLWYTASQYRVLQAFQVPAGARAPGDIIIMWRTSGAPVGGNSEHTMMYIGNNWYIDVTGHTKSPVELWDACQQRNRYNLDDGYNRFFRLPPSWYPDS